MALDGGGLYGASTAIHISNMLFFTGNKARGIGGAVLITNSSLYTSSMGRYYFVNNSGTDRGGAIYCSILCNIEIKGYSVFNNNYLEANISYGGAIAIEDGNFSLFGTVLLSNNQAFTGGAIFLSGCNALLRGDQIVFRDNFAHEGGGMFCESFGPTQVTTKGRVIFTGNTAASQGGAVGIRYYDSRTISLSGHFIDNRAKICGGAVYAYLHKNLTFKDAVVTGNSGTALCFSESDVKFSGRHVEITNNTGKFGGGINSTRSSISFISNITIIEHNRAYSGGAIYSLYGTISFKEHVEMAYNTAEENGGAIFLVGTAITIEYRVCFSYNSARKGGAIYFQNAASLTLVAHSVLNTSRNFATEFGGAIYSEDVAVPIQCNSEIHVDQVDDEIASLPYCFIQLRIKIIGNRIPEPINISSNYDSAGKDGSFLYGGMLDRCQMDIKELFEPKKIVPYSLLKDKIFDIKTSQNNNESKSVTSKPYQLCFCEDCSRMRSIEVHRGQVWTLALKAIDQIKAPTSTRVTAITGSNARLKFNQNLQVLEEHCSVLTYNVFSTEDYEELILYPDGPCRDTGLTTVVIKVTLLPCPDAFFQSGEQCVCEERLQAYETDCVIDDSIYITRRSGSKFWMKTLYMNGSYSGLVLYSTCPSDYCNESVSRISLDSLDTQCNLNRTGMLCGACAANYSLMLGGSQCQNCSNIYLTLLLPFAAAGIALVVFLTFLRLTVATGMINSLILYANIVQANKAIFLPVNTSNVLTVFIAWLNLDLGIQTCFYDGMDAYAQTWLQFAFPVYVWLLIGLIILSSRYSITVSKLIGSNPIAVLATLLLMSYTKILKIIIEVYSTVKLDYPDDKKVHVWLKDANVPFFGTKHLVLVVVTALVLIVFFLPYTLLLLLGHKLYRFSGCRYLLWLNKMKPLLDSYYAPYRTLTRYWTGLLLLVRCALYAVFSYNSLGGQSNSLLAIIITFSALVVIAWLSVMIYKSVYVNAIEALMYLNLIMFSAVAATNNNTPALVNSLLSVAFITMAGIILYHFHLLYIVKSSAWLKAKGICRHFFEKLKMLRASKTVTVPVPGSTSSHDPHKIVSETVIELREPLLEK